jgi:predicted nucleic acid-binding protein
LTGFVVIDTNVVVSGVLGAPGSTSTCRIVDAMGGGHLRFVLSDTLIREYRRVLLRQSIVQRHGLSETEVDRILVEIVVNATMREPKMLATGDEPTRAGEDSVPAGDAHVAALLRSMPGCVLVTGDKRLADAVRPWREVVTPAVFAATLEA